MIKLSIIIPYYDTYEYTIKLLKELRIQKTDEVEVILIDDGCYESRFDEFTEFTIIHSEHIGASAAWNLGISKSIGKYIGFIDSDDMIIMDYIDVLIDAIDKELADEIMFDWIDWSKGKVVVCPTARAIWKAIYIREIVPAFEEERVCRTDVPFQIKLNRTPHTKFRISKPLYIYRSKREGSITWRKLRGELHNPPGFE